MLVRRVQHIVSRVEFNPSLDHKVERSGNVERLQPIRAARFIFIEVEFPRLVEVVDLWIVVADHHFAVVHTASRRYYCTRQEPDKQELDVLTRAKNLLGGEHM